MGQYEFPNPEWSEVSEEGRNQPFGTRERVCVRAYAHIGIGVYLTCCWNGGLHLFLCLLRVSCLWEVPEVGSEPWGCVGLVQWFSMMVLGAPDTWVAASIQFPSLPD